MTIIDIAERMIRDGGYHSFSFRQIADELGIKSASIHYHFPSKDDLGEAVIERYTENFMTALSDPNAVAKPIQKYIAAFEGALRDSERGCLCGVLSGEAGKLPEGIRDGLKKFTEENLAWLESALMKQCPDWPKGKRKQIALLVFSALEGAISIAAMTERGEQLKAVGDSLKKLVSS